LRSAALHPRLLLVIIFFVLFFVLFTRPIYEGDCFWHLATGRWIAEHHTLPTSDPFSFTVTDHNPFRPESKRVEFLLKQYWLGQLAMFGTWTLGGDAGIVLLRATVYTSILVFIFIWMQRLNKGILPLVLTFLMGMLLRDYPNERPQLFSFLFMPILLYLLEEVTQTVKSRRLVLIALPLIMLVWANTHGAYILGVVLVVIYLSSHLTECAIHRREPDYPFIVSAVAGITITVLNPAGLLAWTESLHSLSSYTSTITEYRSPWRMAITFHNWYPAYWTYVFIFAGVALTSWRTMKTNHLLVLAALTLLSLTAVRYVYFPLLAAPLLVRYLPVIACNAYSIAVATLVGGTWLGVTWNSSILAFRASDNFPTAAISFIRNEKPAPRIFNYYDWGGYLAWAAPGLKTFIDGRALVEEISDLHSKTLSGERWRDTFEHYGINTVIIPGMSITTPGYPWQLATTLAAASEWQLVFVDDRTLVFARDIPANRGLIARHAKDRLALQIHLLSLADYFIEIFPEREEFWETKANALAQLGDQQGALAAYRKTLQINPHNKLAKRMLSAWGN
jgi:hypothetical protein